MANDNAPGPFQIRAKTPLELVWEELDDLHRERREKQTALDDVFARITAVTTKLLPDEITVHDVTFKADRRDVHDVTYKTDHVAFGEVTVKGAIHFNAAENALPGLLVKFDVYNQQLVRYGSGATLEAAWDDFMEGSRHSDGYHQRAIDARTANVNSAKRGLDSMLALKGLVEREHARLIANKRAARASFDLTDDDIRDED